jgi:hypothetical protein
MANEEADLYNFFQQQFGGAAPAAADADPDAHRKDIQFLLTRLAGSDPFARGGSYASEQEEAARGGPMAPGALHGIPPEFVREIFDVLADHDLGLEDFGVDRFYGLVQGYWQDKAVRGQYEAGFSVRAHINRLLKKEGLFGPGGRKGKSLESQLHEQYPGIVSLYHQYFGRTPSVAEIQATLAQGKELPEWEAHVRGLPSHLAGIAIGPYSDLRGLANEKSQKIYGHDSNDTIIKELYDQGLTVSAGVQYYYDQLPFKPGAGGVPPIVYNTVYRSAAEYTKAVWGQEPHPMDLHTLWQRAGSPDRIGSSEARQAAEPTPALPGAA